MRRMLLLFLCLVLMTLSLSSVMAQSNQADDRYVGTVAAPPFPTTVDWLNVENPLTWEGLRGKIVILDFWTYGCINCIHMMPVLHDLEERFADELIIIGVHSGKFEGEQQTDNLEQIVRRYEINHPVINDADYAVWRTFGVNAWPTFVVIDPNGNVIGAQAGEVPFEAFEVFLSNTIEYYDNNPDFGTIDRTPVEFALEGAGDPGTALAFPGKVLAHPESNRLFIADTNHHRIVIADLTTYEVLEIIGNGSRGYNDGAYAEATFDQPQGLELVGNTLYVADVNNHAIREIDLDEGVVRTLAGTGNMATVLVGFETRVTNPETLDLRSPWDVALGNDNILYIAMAGSHQLWQINLETRVLQPSVGNALEAQLSTTIAGSELAQPSGLHWHDGLLYFADSESSTVRVANFAEDSVAVISGTTENSLFDYGDVDGAIGESRLQHALGVTANDDGSLIYITDTYNNKIKVFDTETEVTTSLFGFSDNGGYRDGSSQVAEFDEPGGLDYADGLLYVADTNNHVIRVIDLEADSVSTLQFPNPQALVIDREEPTILGGNSADGVVIDFDPQTVSVGMIDLNLNFVLPEGYKINELTDSTVDFVLDDLVSLPNAETNRVVISEENTTIPIVVFEGDSTISMTIALFYCEEDSYCLIDDLQINIPLVITIDAENTVIDVTREVILPEFLAITD